MDSCSLEILWVYIGDSLEQNPLISLRDSRRGNSRLRGLEDGKIDFTSWFPPRQLEARGIWARILELDIGTIKNGFRACDLTPGGSKKRSYRFLMHWMWVDVDGYGCMWMCMAWKRIGGTGKCGDSVRTSLKNAQNFAKTSKLRQNSVKVTFDTRNGRSWLRWTFFLHKIRPRNAKMA